jgi:TRAP-type C4-dicarboxylate transport system permease small subunit
MWPSTICTARSARTAQLLRALVLLCLALFFIFMTISSSDYVWRTRFQTTAATDIPISFIYAAMPVGFVLMLVHLLFIARGYIADGSYKESNEIDGEAAGSL